MFMILFMIVLMVMLMIMFLPGRTANIGWFLDSPHHPQNGTRRKFQRHIMHLTRH